MFTSYQSLGCSESSVKFLKSGCALWPKNYKIWATSFFALIPSSMCLRQWRLHHFDIYKWPIMFLHLRYKTARHVMSLHLFHVFVQLIFHMHMWLAPTKCHDYVFHVALCPIEEMIPHWQKHICGSAQRDFCLAVSSVTVALFACRCGRHHWFIVCPSSPDWSRAAYVALWRVKM